MIPGSHAVTPYVHTCDVCTARRSIIVEVWAWGVLFFRKRRGCA